MAEAILEGGLYQAADGSYHDAKGNKVEKKKGDAAIAKRMAERRPAEEGRGLTVENGGKAGPKPASAPKGAEGTPEGTEPGTPLPEDFPGGEELRAEGFTTVEQVKALSVDELDAVRGIGPATAKAIQEALAG